jgi:hypothetical protein
LPTILALTLGGSWQPIITAINTYQPDFVLFFATSGTYGSIHLINGPGKPCEDRENSKNNKANILTQTGLHETQYQIILINQPDDLNECFMEIFSILQEQNSERTTWRKIADYTGGTKSMSVALAFAALHLKWELTLVQGARINLIKVEDGSQMSSLINGWEIYCVQQMEVVRDLFNNFEFAPAAKILKTLPIQYPISTELKQKINHWLNYCQAFEAWDAFNHQQAMNLLAPYQSEMVPQWIFLKSVLGITRGHGYEFVEDLLLNAERCIFTNRFDDAAARLYRSLEMLAQIRLGQLEPAIDTSDVDIQLVPKELQPSFLKMMDDKENIKIGLSMDYELLQALGDPLGMAYFAHKNEFLTNLTIRNQSILAHGNSPVTKHDVSQMYVIVTNLLNQFYQTMGYRKTCVQFPRLDAAEVGQRDY